MELVALWFDSYKVFGETQISLNPKFKCNFIKESNKLKINIIDNQDYHSVYPENLNIITIVGENGSGKSTIINIINSIIKDKKDIPNEYCLVFSNGTEYIYKKSENVVIDKISKMREWLSTTKNGYPVGDKCEILNFKPFLEKDFSLDHWEYYNSYDKELTIQDQINNYFIYDRPDENIVAFTIGRTINSLKNIKFFTETKNIVFEKFGWEFNLKDCYEHMTKRLRKLLKDGLSYKFPFTFQFRFHNSKYSEEYFELVNKIVFFKNDNKYDWNKEDLNISEIMSDICFLTGICEFGFFLSYLAEILNNYYADDFRNAYKDNLKLAEIEQKKIEVIDEILSYIINSTSEKMSKIEFLDSLIEIFSNKSLNYNNFAISNKNKFLENINKTKNILLDITILENFFKTYFDKNKLNFRLKENFRLSLDKFLKNNEFNEYTTCFSAIYLYKYLGINNAIDKTCQIFPEDFIAQYFNINLYKNAGKDSITFKNLSTGEQRILKLFADFLYCNPRDIYLLDEIDMSWHPEWQREMISLLVEVLKLDKYQGKTINLLITTHSPIVLSDIPKENVVLLYKDIDNSSKIESRKMPTFAANIHELFNDSFFLGCNGELCTIGEYAKTYIKDLQNKLKVNTEKYYTKFGKLDEKKLLNQINIIDEPIIRNAFLKEYYKKYDNRTKEDLSLENYELKQKIEQLKGLIDETDTN